MKRVRLLVLGCLVYLYSGVIYIWSIAKVPLAEEFGFELTQLSFAYTAYMVLYCFFVLLVPFLVDKVGYRGIFLLATVCYTAFLVGFALNPGSLLVVYLTFSLLHGMGVAFSYPPAMAVIQAWFPEKKGMATGILMMMTGFSPMIMSKLADYLFGLPQVGWRKTFLIMAVGEAVIFLIASFMLDMPGPDVKLPEPKAATVHSKRDFTRTEMIKTSSFWFCVVALTLGQVIYLSINNASREFAISVGATVSLAVTLVGVLSLCNGVGRLISGFLADKIGSRITTVIIAVFDLIAAVCFTVAVLQRSVLLITAGLCVMGLAYGAIMTISSTFVAEFYGQKYFTSNYSIVNLKSIVASLFPTIMSMLLVRTGSYLPSMILFVVFGVIGLIFSLMIKKSI